MPALKRKPRDFNNHVYSSVKFLSTTKAIDTAVDHVQKSISELSSSSLKIDPNTKSIICSI